MKKTLAILLSISGLSAFASNIYVPMGTILVGQLLNGANLKSSKVEDPDPVIMKVIFDDGKNPTEIVSKVMKQNNKTIGLADDFPDCKVTGVAILDKAINRAKIRAENIECVFQDGRTFNGDLHGYFIDYSDQKAGIIVENHELTAGKKVMVVTVSSGSYQIK